MTSRPTATASRRVLVVDQFCGVSPYWLQKSRVQFEDLVREALLEQWGAPWRRPEVLEVAETWSPPWCTTAVVEGEGGVAVAWKWNWDSSG